MAVRLSLMYGALFLLFGVQLPYLPVWLHWKGLSADTIAIVLAVPLVLRIVFMPVVGYWADRTNDAVGVARVLSIGAALFTGGLVLGESSFTIMLLVVGMMICAPSLNPLTETLALAAVREGQAEYGNVRLWGSATFIVANVGAGLVIDWIGAGAVSWMMFGGALLTVIALWLLPRGAAGPRTVTQPARGVALADVRALLQQPAFVVLMVTAGVLQASHAVFYIYGVLHWQSLGYSTTIVGGLWAIAVIAEIVLFRAGRQFLAGVGAIGLLIAGGVAGALRWGIMAFDPVLAVLVVLQVGHALTYAASHMGTMHLIARIVPQPLAGSAQALLAAFMASIAMSLATVIAGLLYVRAGGLSYLAMAALSVVGVMLALLLQRFVSREMNF